MKPRLFLPLFFLVVGISCTPDKELFTKISPQKSGMDFNNLITETMEMNIIDEENIYNGGGVGVGDFNNDGLMDVYFTGSMVENKLYLNKGDFQFEDITHLSGTEAADRWSRGVAIVDINSDGWQDIYVSCTILKEPDKRENLLFINQGAKEGIPRFVEQSKAYGLNSDKHSTQASFFDYDQDGDLDVFVANNVFAIRDNPNNFRKRFVKGEHPSTDQLFRNSFDSTMGHPVFTDVSEEAGIQQEGYSHSVITCDINRDGWTDVFIANDYLSENLFYINNQDGTFTNRSKELLKHTAFNAMGADVVDINNDDLDDIVELDMNPEDNFRKKTMLGGARYEAYQLNLIYGFQFQYIRNMLHLNRGSIPSGEGSPMFSDIGFFAGIAETDWSWTPLVADFNLDGWKDLIVTNGFPKDVTDHDFMAFRNSAFGMNDKAKLLDMIPEVKISNYAYQNLGGTQFQDATEEWGLSEPSFSNGAAFADLDNDGDLDVIINNIDAPASLYRNNGRGLFPENNFLSLSLIGTEKCPNIIGTRVQLKVGNQRLTNYAQPVRGYLSSHDPRLHFGVGSQAEIDTIWLSWPNGMVDTLTDIPSNQNLELSPFSLDLSSSPQGSYPQPFLKEVSQDLGLVYVHQAKDLNDYSVQRTLPHKYSQLGPKMKVADFNGDNREDLIIHQQDSMVPALFLQSQEGFYQRPLSRRGLENISQKASALAVWDLEGDGDVDILIGLSQYENLLNLNQEEPSLILLVNNGEANFEPFPIQVEIPFNISILEPINVDGKGVEELFVGCHSAIGQYPATPSAYLLQIENEQGKYQFVDITGDKAPVLEELGIVNDALWRDVDGDKDMDLVVVGDYMPVTLVKNEGNRFSQKIPLTNPGWWKSIESSDVDQDGDIDFLIGNYGLNSAFTVEAAGAISCYYQDNDSNGVLESLLTRTFRDRKGKKVRYVANSRDEVVALFPSVKKQHLAYKSFAQSSLEGLFSQEVFNKFQQVEADEFRSGILYTIQADSFEFIPFPKEGQWAPIFDFLVWDIDRDGLQDILAVGNYYGTEVFHGRQNAFNGLALRKTREGPYQWIPNYKSGFAAREDAKDLVTIEFQGREILIVSQHNGPIKGYAFPN